MEVNDEHDYTYNFTYDYTYDYSGYDDSPNIILYKVQEFLIFPIILITNLILVCKIFGSKKIRSEPWRWLIAHTSICIVMEILLHYDELMWQTYQLPTLGTTPLCPAVRVAQYVIGRMVLVSFTLVAIERFRALQHGEEKEGGMGKKAVILSLVLFWIGLICSEIVHIIVVKIIVGVSAFPSFEHRGHSLCYRQGIGLSIVSVAILLWAGATAIVVLIGAVVYFNKKTTTAIMKKSIAAPTLAFLMFFFFLTFLPHSFHTFATGPGHDSVVVYFVAQIFQFVLAVSLITLIVFPITWLATWSRNGDISWNRKVCPCCPAENDEECHLLEEK